MWPVLTRPEPHSLRLWTPCFPGHQESIAPSSHQGHRMELAAGVDLLASGAMVSGREQVSASGACMSS